MHPKRLLTPKNTLRHLRDDENQSPESLVRSFTENQSPESLVRSFTESLHNGTPKDLETTRALSGAENVEVRGGGGGGGGAENVEVRGGPGGLLTIRAADMEAALVSSGLSSGSGLMAEEVDSR